MTNNLSFKVIDLSGYSFSGKSAVFDLLSEFEGYKTHSKEFEFELLRTAGGILDLESALVNNWSPIRSSEAIRRFKKLVKSHGGTNSFLSRLFSIGYQYDSFFPEFSEMSQDYIKSLIKSAWNSEWSFALNDLPLSTVVFKKIKRKLGFRNAFEFEVYLSRLSEDEFTKLTQIYLQRLFSRSLTNESSAIVLNNMFEPFYPLRSHKYFTNPKSIIVDRDPRDVYISAVRQGIVGNANVGKAVIGNDLNDFIKRFKLYREGNENSAENILKLNFEDLVLNYEESKQKIFTFLGEDPSIHLTPQKYFDPVKSKQGICQWEGETGDIKKAVDIIYSELKEFCVKT